MKDDSQDNPLMDINNTQGGNNSLPNVEPNAPEMLSSKPIVSTPPTAGDVELIEKEWVEKAKHIVDQTKDDPYKQQQAISTFKADYMKKRYGKDVKTTDSKVEE